MATVTANYTPAAGRQYVDLTSWAGDAAFATPPVATDQIEAPASLTLNADGTVSGPDGTYTLRHIQYANGSTEGVSHSLSNPDVTAPTLSNLSVSPDHPDTLDGGVDTDEGNGTLYAYASTSASETDIDIEANAQASQSVPSAGRVTFSVVGLVPGSYYLHVMHKDAAGNRSNVLSSTQVTLIESASVVTTYGPGASRSFVTLEAPIEPYLFEGWPAQPEAGEQLAAQTSAGTFDVNGNFETDVEAVIPVHHIALDGTVTRFTIDTTGLEGAADTIPDAYTLNSLTNQARDIYVTSNTVTVTGVDGGTPVPISVSGDSTSQYSVSTDGGNTWGGWTSSPTTVQLNYRVRVRHRTSDQYYGTVITTLNIGGVERTFTSQTLPDTVAPTISLVGGNVQIPQGSVWSEPGYTATDNADGDLTLQVQVSGTVDTSLLGPQTLQYTVTDAAGNTTTVTRTVTVVATTPTDTTPPVISLTGGNLTLQVGDTWDEPGFIATDNTDGDITDSVVVTGAVDTSRVGTYTRLYTVTDAAGNTGTATRIVTVLPATQYPLDALAPTKRTFEVSRLTEPFANEPLAVVQSGEVLDFDFDLDAWLTDEGDAVAEGSYSAAELSDALEVLAVGQVPGTNRVKIWLGVGDVTESESSLVELTVTTTGYRTGVFHFRALVIDRMQ